MIAIRVSPPNITRLSIGTLPMSSLVMEAMLLRSAPDSGRRECRPARHTCWDVDVVLAGQSCDDDLALSIKDSFALFSRAVRLASHSSVVPIFSSGEQEYSSNPYSSPSEICCREIWFALPTTIRTLHRGLRSFDGMLPELEYVGKDLGKSAQPDSTPHFPCRNSFRRSCSGARPFPRRTHRLRRPGFLQGYLRMLLRKGDFDHLLVRSAEMTALTG